MFTSNAGKHAIDLFAVHRTPGGWSNRVLLTKDSSASYNQQPSISDDGTRVLFDCGNDPGSGEGTSICEVGTDGAGFKKVVESPQAPRGSKRAALHHADYAPDGHVVFEGTWNEGAEQVWQAPLGKDPALVNAERDEADGNVWRFTDDNSPCVLPDGRIVSLWLGRTGSGNTKASGHELKVMNADGSHPQMLLTDVDVVDMGIGCSK